METCYTLVEVARLSKIGRTTVYAEIKAGRLIARRIAQRRSVVLASDLERWLKALPSTRNAQS